MGTNINETDFSSFLSALSDLPKGCGRKRTSLNSLDNSAMKKRTVPEGDIDEMLGMRRVSLPHPLANDIRNVEDIGDFAELFNVNAEPAVAEVQRQIMSQAKINEAIKDAQEEILRQELQQALRMADNRSYKGGN